MSTDAEVNHFLRSLNPDLAVGPQVKGILMEVSAMRGAAKELYKSEQEPLHVPLPNCYFQWVHLQSTIGYHEAQELYIGLMKFAFLRFDKIHFRANTAELTKVLPMLLETLGKHQNVIQICKAALFNKVVKHIVHGLEEA